MKIRNTTDFPTAFLRRLTSWCCRQTDLPPSKLGRATFRNTSHAYSGLATWGEGIIVRIGPEERYPVPPHSYGGGPVMEFRDRLEGLVAVTAHEIGHHVIWHERVKTHRKERMCESLARMALEAFRRDRERLMALWSGNDVADDGGEPEPVSTPAPAAAAVTAPPADVAEAEPDIAPEAPAPVDTADWRSVMVARRRAKAEADLKRWTKKLKLAQTKVKKLKKKVAYYQKRSSDGDV